jgi:LysR family transcriptional regulator, benzoate and cis,cis-muconate-responsive activator of ben and cat genes
MTALDLRQLECFVAVAEERNVGRAAARLHMTQPPLTRRMTRLEHDLGVQLLIRDGSGATLTAAGEVLLERAYRLLRLSEHTVERTRLAGDGQVGQLLVGYFGSTIFGAVPRLLRGFLTAYPGLSVCLERAAKNDQADALLDGRLHVGFSRMYRDQPGLTVRKVLTEPLYAAVPAGHALLRQAEVRVADLRDEPLVVFPSAPRPSFADQITQICQEAGFTPHVAREAEDAVTALAYVACGGLVAVVPGSATALALDGTAFVPLSDGPRQDLSCLYRAGDVPPVMRQFLSYLDNATESG